jgi:hypothetical protein
MKSDTYSNALFLFLKKIHNDLNLSKSALLTILLLLHENFYTGVVLLVEASTQSLPMNSMSDSFTSQSRHPTKKPKRNQEKKLLARQGFEPRSHSSPPPY